MSPLVLQVVEYLGVLTGVLCVWLTVRQNVWCWPIGIVNVLLYALVFFQARLYPDVVLQGVYLVLSVYGWWRWLHPGAARDELPVTRLTRGEALLWIAVSPLAAYAIGWYFEHRTQANLPYWNASTVVLSLVAQWLMTRKILENWHVWIAADLVMTGVYLASGLRATAGLYVLYTGLAVKGLLDWRRTMPVAPAPAA